MNGRIETQDVLFGQKNAKRVVEIGASNVLAVMAQRTLAAKYEAHDAIQSIQRKILTWTKDMREICYEIDAEEESIGSSATPAVIEQNDVAVTQPVQPAQQLPSRPKKVTAIPDAALSPIDVLRAIVAQKLKRSMKDVAPRLSIKDLTGG